MDAARRIQYEDDAPAAEPMRAQRRERTNPSREDIKVRRRQERAQRPAQVRTAALQCLACGCQGRGAPAGSRCPACGSLAVQANWETWEGHGRERMTDWDAVTKGWDMNHARIHRSITLYPDSDVYNKIEDPSVPNEEKAQHLLNHLQSGGRPLGRHWSTDLNHAKRVASDEGWSAIGNNESEKEENEFRLPLSVIVHAKFPERHHIEDDPDVLEEHHVTPWGGSEHYGDEAEVPLKEGAHVHVTGLSWSTKTHPRPSEWTTHRYDKDTEAHEQAEEAARQERLDNLKKTFKHEGKLASGAFHVQMPPDVHARVVDENRPAGERAKELLDHLGQGHGSIHWSEGATSMPLGRAKMSANELHRKTGSPAISGELRGVTPEGTTKYDMEHGLSGIHLPIHAMRWQESAPEHPYKSTEHEHEFGDHPMVHKATRLPTQIERANPGDFMRTPQGQSVKIVKVRPHETENDKVYVDTDMGTSIMSRGTDVELVPHNSQQQELPGSGNPNGNSGHLPGSGQGSGGGGLPGKAPHCPVDGTKMVFRNKTWVCPVDGTTGPTGAAPEGMSPVDTNRGHLIDRPRQRAVPQTHLWASRYNTVDRPPMAVQTAERVLSTMEGNR